MALFLGLRQVLWPEFHPSWAVWFVRSLQCSSLTDAFVSESASPSVSNLLIRIHKSVAVILGFFSVALFYKELSWLPFILSAGIVLLSHIFALASRK